MINIPPPGKWDSEDSKPSPSDPKRQREKRARAFKLKKWILNIESQSNKSPLMEQKLEAYYIELNQLQGERGGLNENTAQNIMKITKKQIKDRRIEW